VVTFFLSCLQDGSGSSLELDLEHYVVPTPTAPPTEYAANLAATPASLTQPSIWTNDIPLSDGIQSPSASADFQDHSDPNKVRCNLEKLVC
jgi:6-phosphofructo-2-kinase/fructose-2,6-biphosphatase